MLIWFFNKRIYATGIVWIEVIADYFEKSG